MTAWGRSLDRHGGTRSPSQRRVSNDDDFNWKTKSYTNDASAKSPTSSFSLADYYGRINLHNNENNSQMTIQKEDTRKNIQKKQRSCLAYCSCRPSNSNIPQQ
eukprot:TRINITY_DN6997_c0_g1_i1.p1 TRINITY_DN6997_c0_g1~~TRINITY_DN6997_c0_g1_i1.p1  ORF type:complete len:103 (-),score=12.40 TRINITY_DN6997_c0_g1_i1:64-372(-)